MTITTLSRTQGVSHMGAEKPFKIELPDAERGRGADELARLDVLNRRLSSPPKARGRMSADAAREADLAERDELEQRPQRQAESQWARDAADETAALAEGRGEEVTRAPGGRLEIVSHDALRRLLMSGKLTPDQHEAGEALRECYEKRAGDVGSQMGNLAPGGSGHDNHQFVANRFRNTLATVRAQAVENAVLTGAYRLKDGSLKLIDAFDAFKAPGAPPPHVALAVLRKICGENIGLTEQGRGRAFERNSRALIIALDITRECLMSSRARLG